MYTYFCTYTFSQRIIKPKKIVLYEILELKINNHNAKKRLHVWKKMDYFKDYNVRNPN
jgi:hypothetical protein